MYFTQTLAEIDINQADGLSDLIDVS
jgi:hypothetical protein